LLLVALLALLSPSRARAQDAARDVEPSLEQIFRPPRLLGVRPDRARVSADGRYVVYRCALEDALSPKRALWLAGADGRSARKLFDDAAKVHFWWTPRGSRLLVHRRGWLELRDLGGEEPARPLFRVVGEISDLEFVEGGAAVVVLAGKPRRLWELGLANGRRRDLSAGLENVSRQLETFRDGKAHGIFAAPSTSDRDQEDGGEEDGGDETEGPVPRVLHIVSEEAHRETGLREGGEIRISAGGEWAARSRVTRDSLRELVLADYLTDDVSTVRVRDSLAGDPTARVTITLHDLERDTEWAPAIDSGDRYHLRGLHWSPDGELLMVDRLSDFRNVREIILLDPRARSVRAVYTESDEAWIGGPFLAARWSHDGNRILFTSERSGFNHIWSISRAGGEPVAVTSGEHEIRWFRLLERSSRALLITSERDPAESTLGLVDLRSGARRALSRSRSCVYSPRVSASEGTVVYSREELGVPRQIVARSLSEGGSPVRVSRMVSARLTALDLSPPSIVEYRNPDDDRTVRAFLYRPRPFDPDVRYPAVVFVHGAGYLQNVTRSMSSYDVNMLFHHRLARKGYVVLDADYRHSKGYGRDFRTAIWGHMGGKDLDDVVAGVGYLESLGYVDVDRVGVYGGSYGGFLTLMALFTKPEVFACGAALRSVTDWRKYHPSYTNPRLGDPKIHPENYRKSSPIDHAEGLLRPLLLLHGMKDSNVFAQDTIRLIEKLIRLGKDFDAMLYPSQNHAFTDPASWIDEYRRIERFFDRHLRLAAPRRPRTF